MKFLFLMTMFFSTPSFAASTVDTSVSATDLEMGLYELTPVNPPLYAIVVSDFFFGFDRAVKFDLSIVSTKSPTDPDGLPQKETASCVGTYTMKDLKLSLKSLCQGQGYLLRSKLSLPLTIDFNPFDPAALYAGDGASVEISSSLFEGPEANRSPIKWNQSYKMKYVDSP